MLRFWLDCTWLLSICSMRAPWGDGTLCAQPGTSRCRALQHLPHIAQILHWIYHHINFSVIILWAIALQSVHQKGLHILVIWCYNLLRCTVQEHSPTIFVIFKWRQHQHQRQILQMVGGDFWSRILSVLRFVDLKIQQLCPVTWFEAKPKRCRNDKIRAPVVSKVFHQDLYLHLPQSNTIPVPIIITMSSFPCCGTLLFYLHNSARLN